MKKRFSLCCAMLLCVGMLAGCVANESPVSSGSDSAGAGSPASQPPQSAAGETGQPVEAPDGVSTVYMTTNISAQGLVAIYEALGAELPEGNIAVKISTGESGSNYLRPELIGDLVQAVNGTIVECNTAYGGQRANTAYHRQVAEDHGYTAIADVDIMDADGSMTLPVTGVTHLTENYEGSHVENYD